MNIKKRMLALILAISMQLNLVGCRQDDRKDKKKDFDTSDYQSKIEEILPDYKNEDYYRTQDDVTKLMNMARTTKECEKEEILSSIDIAIKDCIEKIIKNSKEANEDESIMLFSYDVREHQVTIGQVLESALHDAMTSIFADAQEREMHDVSEDICRLSTLKIVQKELSKLNYYEYDEKTNTVYLDVEGLLNYALVRDSLFSPTSIREAFTVILEKALNTARLYICDCRIENGQAYNSVMEADSLHTIFDIARNYQALNSGEDYGSLNYAFELNISEQREAILLLLVAFKSQRSLTDLMNATYNSDLEGIYEFFGLDDEKKATTFYKIVDSIDGLSFNGPLLQKIVSSESDPIPLEEYQSKIGYSWVIDIYKVAINDLIQSIKRYEFMSLDTSLALYTFAKSHVAKEIKTTTVDYDLESAIMVSQIEDVFYSFIKDYYNIGDEELSTALKESVHNLSKILENKHDDVFKMFPMLESIQKLDRFVNYHNEDFDEFMKQTEMQDKKPILK